MKNILITVPFIIILLVLLFWLVRALMPSPREQAAEFKKDKFELAGYETIAQIRRKEYSVIVVGTVAILLCLGIIFVLGYVVIQAGIAGQADSAHALNLLLVFIPAVVLFGLIISASRRYLKHQDSTLHEFQKFKSSRQIAIKEYQAKRSGKQEEKEGTAKPKGSNIQKSSQPARTRKERNKRKKPGQGA